MAFNRKFFNLFKYLLPKSNAFNITIQKLLTKFFEGLTALPDDFRTFLDNIWNDIFPLTTRSPELWETQFGIRLPNSNDTLRRNEIDTRWKLKGGQSLEYIQGILNDAGFDVQLHENNPPVDPDNFISANFVMTCGMTTAVCGNDDAFCGKTGGYILANGFIPDTSDLRDYLMVCGGDIFTPVTAGEATSVCGYFEQFIVYPKTYEVPNDSDYWPYIFFVGGDATRNATTHVLETIDTVNIPNSRRSEFENLLLKLKPVHTWAGMIIDFTG